MQFKVYDSLTRKKQPLFKDDNTERTDGIYVCGPTVYQRIHIGNARPYLMFGMFVRYLRAVGLTVKWVSNITDINDKIYHAATEQKISSTDLAEQATAWYVEDTDRLGIGRPDVEPKASESLDEQVTLIEELIAKGLAYEAGGDVYFRVEQFKQYGRLSGQEVAELQPTDDDDGGSHKERPLDFALWKATKASEDTSWDSPWGKGRPGWHIECSAMAEKHLGPEFDIHGGGIDLIFPHHENEFAQSRGSKRKFARIWMHNGLIQVGGEKMGKSEGNFMLLNEVLDTWPLWVVVMFFFGASYRNPIDMSNEAMEESRAKGDRITEALRRGKRYLDSVDARDAGDPGHSDAKRNWVGIHEALHDDFNTANAIGEVFGLVHDLNTAVSERATPQIVRDVSATLEEFLRLFRMEDVIPDAIEIPDKVTGLIEEREGARIKKDFDAADELRDKILSLGFLIRDTPDGVDVVQARDQAATGA